jgi:hypothetical protein
MAEQTKKARRTFFAGLGLVAAAGVAAKVASTTTLPKVAEAAPSEPEGDGYRLTDHIKKYYRTTHI